MKFESFSIKEQRAARPRVRSSVENIRPGPVRYKGSPDYCAGTPYSNGTRKPSIHVPGRVTSGSRWTADHGTYGRPTSRSGAARRMRLAEA